MNTKRIGTIRWRKIIRDLRRKRDKELNGIRMDSEIRIGGEK